MGSAVVSSQQIYLFIGLVVLTLAQPFAGQAQTAAPPPLPPAAQQALDKGIIAAKVPDYPLAIRFFEAARKIAPEAPVIYLNLGIAESKIPGRELRAIAWFGAYLAASPDAPNAAAVKEQIAVLDVRHQSNLSRLLETVQKAVSKIPGRRGINDYEFELNFEKLAIALAQTGNIAAAQKEDALFKDSDSSKTVVQTAIANAQAEAGDIAGAKITLASAIKAAGLVPIVEHKVRYLGAIAEVQIIVGDVSGAKATLTNAQRIAELIENAYYKGEAQKALAVTQAKAGMPVAPIVPPVAVSEWIYMLDYSPVNSEPFLDLRGYLKSLPPSNNPQKVFNDLIAAVNIIIAAQNDIHRMLRQQAIR
jgi:tetratricopeptide (TPR) repeat protein